MASRLVKVLFYDENLPNNIKNFLNPNQGKANGQKDEDIGVAELNVITSYSIHYTKLYEFWQDHAGEKEWSYQLYPRGHK